MKSIDVKVVFFLLGFICIFIVGVLIGYTSCGTKKEPYVTYSLAPSNIETVKEPQLINSESLKSFSFAYNRTHLWSMRLASEDYYRIARLLPCRTVRYTGGRQNETMDSCNQSTINEFSVEGAIHAQQWIYEHQNPSDCTNKRFAIIHTFAWSGFGSTVHQILWAFGTALGENRIAVYRTPGDWLYGSCKSGTPDCFFLPLTNCSIPSKIDGNQTVEIKANIDHWYNPIIPSVFQNRSYNWYRSQLLFYLMRFNPATLAHVQGTVAKYFNPPSVDLNRPYVAVYVRRSDKVKVEMSQAYSLQQYFDLFDEDARRAKISTVYVNSEDQKVFDEFNQLNGNKSKYYKLLSIKAQKNVVFMLLNTMSMEQRGKIILEFLTDLFIEANADLHVGTLTSNWCRLVDEMRLALGKMIPYYTPENRFIVDMR